MSSKLDYYQVLEVEKNAPQDKIRQAYLTLAKKHHPDSNLDNKEESEKKFKEINEAYEVLKDTQKRAAYDQFGHAAFSNSGGSSGRRNGGFGSHFDNSDINDIFSNFFGDVMGSRQRRKSSTKVRGDDLRYNLTISLEEAFSGTDKPISFKTLVSCTSCKGVGSSDGSVGECYVCHGSGVVRMQQGFFTLEQPCSTCHGNGYIIKNPCKTCNGEGRYQSTKNLGINIPAGIQEGNKIKITGGGESGIRGGQEGDLYVFIKIKPHPKFQVHGHDLHYPLNIKLTTAILGGEVELKSIDKSQFKLKIPVGTQNGDKLKLRGKGMPIMKSSSRGDLIVHVQVRIPKTLTKRQKELVEELDKEIEEEHKDGDSSFFSKVKNLWAGDSE